MSAGRAASIAPLQLGSSFTLLDDSLPCKPRELTRREREREDSYVFYSPRNRRTLVITEAINFVFALGLEFNPALEVYVERPRRLRLTPKREIDISFWTRDLRGKETYYLTIPASETLPGYGGTVVALERDLIELAAQRHSVRIELIYERDLVRDGQRLSMFLRLLPFVQSTRRIFGRTAIRDRIDSHFDRVPRASITQLQEAMREFDPASVQAVTAQMIHSGHLRIDDLFAFSNDSVVERMVRYA